MSKASIIASPEFVVVNHYDGVIDGGDVVPVMGLQDGTGGWSPLRPIVLTRLHVDHRVSSAHSPGSFTIDYTVYMNGDTNPGDVVLEIQRDLTSAGQFVDSADGPVIVTPDDYLIIEIVSNGTDGPPGGRVIHSQTMLMARVLP